MNGHRSDWTKRRFQRSPVAEHFHSQNHDFNSHVFLCCIDHDAQWSDDTRKTRESYWIRRLNTIQPHGINKGDWNVKCYVSACWRLTYGHLRIVSEGWAVSGENTMKLHSTDGLTQVGYAKQRPTVLVSAVCDYLYSITLPVNSVSFFLFPLSSYLKLSGIS